MNIFQVHRSEINKITTDFLDQICKPENNLGKKENNYWMIKGNTVLSTNSPEYNDEINGMNVLLQIIGQRGYTDLMIIDR